ncbi:hypothetical protein FD27_GL001524 [Limosilactobacillus frumenti DSM 13145]|uniref:Alpha beta hydrolase superfamily protein n=1 Tax=Limosilactobacillus frumenti DSM 13145 TaxID=1423746 RepID=A0A0R1P8E3_9LACO|nr:alpha/beta hydrolase [Limosilactobacillus frumenti]KRL28743.1 hypothetical protein FD27_GL001524 [Limosilactobacillus frumenti DSM 13145]QFG72082.1 alpha/beta hydrolase [Limosilactobacillus frumenti]
MPKLDELNPRKRSRLILILIILALILLAAPAFVWMRSSNAYLAQQRKPKMSPVIMVPGSSATENRFNQLVNLLNKDTDKKHSLMKIQVGNNDKLSTTGYIHRGDREPIIVIGFKNNHDGYDNIKKQARMLNIAFESLTKQYHFNNFKAFGHSNGGLVWTYWLEKYYSQYSDSITVKRLMTLGTPFNFAEKSIQSPTQMFLDLEKNKKKIPSSLSVISVAGTESYDSDGLVPEESVQAGKYIYQKQVKHYTTMTVTGDDAQHSDLPQNKEIVRIIEQYLLDNKSAPVPVKKGEQ